MASRKIMKDIQRARLGQADSQLALGKCYLSGGEGLPVNHAAAYHWLSAAADQGLGEAAWLIGESVPAEAVDSPGRARSYYEKAATAGSAAAMTVLARWQLAGNFGLERGPTDALSQLRTAAIAGFLDAQIELGGLACQGKAPLEDVKWLKKAAERGAGEAMQLLANHYWQSGRGELWQPGQVPGAANAADMRSEEEQEQLVQALLWHESAWPDADWRNTPPEQAYRRGSLLLRAHRHEALRWLELAASAGHPQAAYLRGLASMGTKYINGMEIDGQPRGPRGRWFPRNYKWAARWLELAAKAPLPEALIGLWVLHGIRGVNLGKRDIRDDFLRQSAELGHSQAAHQLACRLWRPKANGSDVEAIQWWQRAARDGLSVASERLQAATAPGREVLTLEQAAALKALGRHNLALAARLEVGLWCNLVQHECLLLDLDLADSGDFLIIDVRSAYGKANRRFVRLESHAQREAVGRARRILDSRRPAQGDLAGNYLSRKRQFLRWCKTTGIEASQLFSGN